MMIVPFLGGGLESTEAVELVYPRSRIREMVWPYREVIQEAMRPVEEPPDDWRAGTQGLKWPQ
jgi:hypothetical protein